jgi:hypothetical protein
MFKRGFWILALVVAVLGLTTTASGTIRGMITGGQIKDHTIASRHLVDHTIQQHDLSVGLVKSLRGQIGATGAQGLKGETGATGAIGATGATGATGAQGPKGDTGATGLTGATGTTGAKGDRGDPGAGVKLAGSADTVEALPTDAATGDTYLVASTEELYTWDGTKWVDAGPVGVQGPAGPQGATGAAGVSGYTVVSGDAVAIAGADWSRVITVTCPTGKVAVGGGASFGTPDAEIEISASYPAADGQSWTIVVHNYDYGDNTVTPYVICVTAS